MEWRSEGISGADLITSPRSVGHRYAQKLSKHSECLFLWTCSFPDAVDVRMRITDILADMRGRPLDLRS